MRTAQHAVLTASALDAHMQLLPGLIPEIVAVFASQVQ